MGGQTHQADIKKEDVATETAENTATTETATETKTEETAPEAKTEEATSENENTAPEPADNSEIFKNKNNSINKI